MTVHHFCQFKLDHSNGIQAAVWELAKGQAAIGATVEIISLGREPRDDEVQAAMAHGVRLSGDPKPLPRGKMCIDLAKEISREERPAVHLHSVFIPRHTWMATCLRRAGVSYFVSPHGNLGPLELARKRLKKSLYLNCFERTMLRGAVGEPCVSQAEVTVVENLLGNPGTAEHLGNGVDPEPYLSIQRNTPRTGPLKGLSLGKSDVIHKGYDRMFRLADAFAGGVDFHVLRHNQPGIAASFENLRNRHSQNPAVRVKPPVHGPAKIQAYREADVFFHLPRWEVFGMVLVEAALAGLPLVVSSECDLAGEIEAAGAGLVLDAESSTASSTLKSWLAATPLEAVGARAREWAMERYSSGRVAERSLALYRRRGAQT
jgi:glycosyltransferase involved in cell wall biosynthesis